MQGAFRGQMWLISNGRSPTQRIWTKQHILSAVIVLKALVENLDHSWLMMIMSHCRNISLSKKFQHDKNALPPAYSHKIAMWLQPYSTEGESSKGHVLTMYTNGKQAWLKTSCSKSRDSDGLCPELFRNSLRCFSTETFGTHSWPANSKQLLCTMRVSAWWASTDILKRFFWKDIPPKLN